jgi:hypothetical protein
MRRAIMAVPAKNGWRPAIRFRAGALDESGAVLVLALLFMMITGLLILGLLSWSGNNLNSVAAFEQSRSLNYAANSAMEKAIQDVRYSTTACPSTGLSIPANGVTIDVWCIDSVTGTSVETEGGTAASRAITFYACSSTAAAQGICGVPSASKPKLKPYLEVGVTYDDYASSNQIGSSLPCSTTCGTSMTINSWVFENTAI